MTEPAASKKIIAIDILRAVAALGVFFYHNHLGSVISKRTGLHFFNVIDVFGSAYAVPLFFLISGYCIHVSNIKHLKHNNTLPIKEYYKRRFLRIYPTYFVALLFAVLTYKLTLPHYTLSRADLLVHIFSVQGFSVAYFNTINVVLWTISIELAFYLIYPLFYIIRLKYNLIYALAVPFLISATSISYFQIKGSVSFPEYYFVFNLWFAWCCGAYLADKTMLNPADLKKPLYLAAYLFILAGCICLKLVPNSLSILSYQLNILVWTAPLVLVLSTESRLQKHQNLWIIKILAAIGLSSYSLYLLHEPLIYLKNLAVRTYLPQQLQLAGIVTGILIIPLITWYSYCFFEKPFIRQKRSVR